jgi:hypothetical protein
VDRHQRALIGDRVDQIEEVRPRIPSMLYPGVRARRPDIVGRNVAIGAQVPVMPGAPAATAFAASTTLGSRPPRALPFTTAVGQLVIWLTGQLN